MSREGHLVCLGMHGVQYAKVKGQNANKKIFPEVPIALVGLTRTRCYAT